MFVFSSTHSGLYDGLSQGVLFPFLNIDFLFVHNKVVVAVTLCRELSEDGHAGCRQQEHKSTILEFYQFYQCLFFTTWWQCNKL